MTQPSLSYRREIDGLRALAILPVVLFHAFPALLPGGFVGVDIFFVISGFLISGIIFDGLRDGGFSFATFYSRRICRLFPALLPVLAFVLAAGWLVLLPDEYAQLGKHVWGAALYVSNFILRREAGYFDVSAELKPLLHLWSLAIEEQFYIFWPLTAVIAWRRRIDLFRVTAGLLALSFAYNLVRVGANPTATFYLPATRAWELLLGALLAHGERFGWPARGGRVALGTALGADMRAAAGLAAIALAMALLDRNSLFPGWRAAVPALGAMLLISAGPRAAINRGLLSHRLAVEIGRISYPLYLWHWPLLSLARIAEGHEPPAWHRALLVALAVLLAVLTYRLVERPIRFGGVQRRRAVTALATLCVVFALAGQTVQRGWPHPYASRFGIDKVVAASGDWAYPTPDMQRYDLDGHVIRRKPGEGGAVLFVGDSNAEQYWPRMDALADRPGQTAKTLLFLTAGGCPPIPGVGEPHHPHCPGLTDTALAVAQKEHVDTVVVVGQWWGYFQSHEYTIGGRPLADPDGNRQALAALSEFLGRLAAPGRRIYLVLNVPVSAEFDPKALVDRSGFLSFGIKTGGVPLDYFQDRYGTISRGLASAAGEAGATVIDPLKFLCRTKGECPATMAGGEPIYKDCCHLRASFVRSHVDYLDGVMGRQAR